MGTHCNFPHSPHHRPTPDQSAVHKSLAISNQRPDNRPWLTAYFRNNNHREFSRICKASFFNEFHSLHRKLGLTLSISRLSYREVKSLSVEFEEKKKALFLKFHCSKYGSWICKPLEQSDFLNVLLFGWRSKILVFCVNRLSSMCVFVCVCVCVSNRWSANIFRLSEIVLFLCFCFHQLYRSNDDLVARDSLYCHDIPFMWGVGPVCSCVLTLWLISGNDRPGGIVRDPRLRLLVIYMEPFDLFCSSPSLPSNE